MTSPSRRADLLVAVSLAAGSALASFIISAVIGSEVWGLTNFWFEADIPRVVAQMQAFDASRSEVHPLFPLLTFPPTRTLMLLGLSPTTSIRTVMAVTSAAWVGAFFLVLRTTGCRRGDAGLLSVMAAASAGSMLISTVPEAFALGGVSLLFVLGIVAAEERHPVPAGWSVAAATLAWGITVTNGMAAIAAAIAHPSKRSIGLIAGSLGIVVLIAVVLSLVIPGYRTRVPDPGSESRFLLPAEARGPLWITNSFLFHGAIAPEIRLRPEGGLEYPILTTQRSLPGSATALGTVGAAAWAALLAMGLSALVRLRTASRFRLALGATLLGQLLLHLIYGEETFLYSLHILPLLALTIGLATLTRARPVVLVLAAVVTVLGGANNVLQIGEALGNLPP